MTVPARRTHTHTHTTYRTCTYAPMDKHVATHTHTHQHWKPVGRKTLCALNIDVLTIIMWTTLRVCVSSAQRNYGDDGLETMRGIWEADRRETWASWGALWTFLLWARLDCWLRDGVKDTAVLPRVVPVTDTLHLITAGLQEREMTVKCNSCQKRDTEKYSKYFCSEWSGDDVKVKRCL